MRAWPLSLDEFLAATLANNPLYTAMRIADPLDEAMFANTCRELLFDQVSADELRQHQDVYHRQVMSLPHGYERLLSLL